MKKSELKYLIKQVVNECISEIAPTGKKSEKMVMNLKESLKRSHPDWSDDKVRKVAYATTWHAIKENSLIRESNVKLCKSCGEEFSTQELVKGKCGGCRHDSGESNDYDDHSVYKETPKHNDDD